MENNVRMCNYSEKRSLVIHSKVQKGSLPHMAELETRLGRGSGQPQGKKNKVAYKHLHTSDTHQIAGGTPA